MAAEPIPGVADIHCDAHRERELAPTRPLTYSCHEIGLHPVMKKTGISRSIEIRGRLIYSSYI
jgi:hypothetical protein